MKKNLILLVALQVIGISCVSSPKKPQTNSVRKDKIVVYDFEKKRYDSSMLKPYVREPLIFKIKNINRLAYDTKITSADVAIADEYFSEKIEETLKKADNNSDKSEPITQKLIAPTQITETLTDSSKTAVIDLTKQKNDIAANLVTMNILKVKVLTEKSKLIDLLQKSEQYDFIKDSLAVEKNKQEILNIESFLNKSAFELDSIIMENKRLQDEIIKNTETIEALRLTFLQFNDRYVDILTKAKKIKLIDEAYQNYYQLALNPLLRLNMYKDLSNDKKFILYQLVDYKLQLNEFDQATTEFVNFYNRSLDNWVLFDAIKFAETKDNIRNKYAMYKEEVDKIKVAINDLNITSKLSKVEALHSILKNEKAYEMVSSPIQPLEDYVTFDIKIKHRDNNKTFEYDDNREFTYMEYTRGGVRFDFSTGVVLNLIGNNDVYGMENVQVAAGESPRKRIVVTDNNQFTPTLAGMFHTSFRTAGIYSFGLTLGASINVETFELSSLFPGVSLMIGKKQKFIISAGPAFRQVQELKANYIENSEYNAADLPDNTVLTSKQFRIGAFVGLTYNLTQKQRAKYKIGSN